MTATMMIVDEPKAEVDKPKEEEPKTGEPSGSEIARISKLLFIIGAVQSIFALIWNIRIITNHTKLKLRT